MKMAASSDASATGEKKKNPNKTMQGRHCGASQSSVLPQHAARAAKEVCLHNASNLPSQLQFWESSATPNEHFLLHCARALHPPPPEISILRAPSQVRAWLYTYMFIGSSTYPHGNRS